MHLHSPQLCNRDFAIAYAVGCRRFRHGVAVRVLLIRHAQNFVAQRDVVESARERKRAYHGEGSPVCNIRALR